MMLFLIDRVGNEGELNRAEYDAAVKKMKNVKPQTSMVSLQRCGRTQR